ncbi:MAG: 8-amino-7-oxononanoate synthase [Balneolaceae bacterium]
MKQTESHQQISDRLGDRKKSSRFRSLNSISEKPDAAKLLLDGELYINFSSNDYLGLSADPLLIERSKNYTERFGTGAASSRLITGTLDIHTKLEEKLASLYQRDRVLLYNTGFQANSTILPAITGKVDRILADKKCHNSILTGCIASHAKWSRFRHNDLNQLEHLLKKENEQDNGNTWIVTESIFSMDGDSAPLHDIISLSKKYGSKLYVDDAHGIGVFGKTGLGCTEGLDEIDLIVGTFGKSAGAFGAFVACSSLIADALINFSNGFIYTTALPPAVVGAIDAAYDRIPAMGKERTHLLELCRYANDSLQKNGFETGGSTSQIIPVITGNDKKTLELSKWLHQNKIFAAAIRPPTVPEGESKIRCTITAIHTREEIDLLLKMIQNG